MNNRMYRITAFAGRCFLELVRDPLAYVFAVGFPLVMLAAMTVLNESIPPEAGMTIFRIDRLAPAVYVFGLSFLMLFTAILVSGDRSEAFLVRLYISPMQRADFLAGYALPVVLLAVLQGILTMAVSVMIALFTDVPLSLAGLFAVIPVSVPAILLFIGFGLLFGALFNPKSAPPLCSVVISLASFLGGMWMELDSMPPDGVFAAVCNVLPFRHAVDAARLAMAGDFAEIGGHPAVVCVWAAAVWFAAGLAFRKRL